MSHEAAVWTRSNHSGSRCGPTCASTRPAAVPAIQANCNLASTLHVDNSNWGPSAIAAVGDIDGGQIWLYDPKAWILSYRLELAKDAAMH